MAYHSSADTCAKKNVVRGRIGEKAIRDLIKRCRDHDSLFTAIDTGPLFGVCERFSKERALRLVWIEDEVRRRAIDVDRLMMDVEAGVWGAEDGKGAEDTTASLETVFNHRMNALADVLDRHARASIQDRTMAEGPSPSQVSMDYFRSHLSRRGENLLAPNGRPVDDYEPRGKPVPSFLTTTFDDSRNMIERLIISRLMNPFTDYVLDPISRCVGCLYRPKRRGDTDSTRKMFVNDRSISGVATAIACMLSNACLAAAIGTLYSISSIQIRLILVSLFSVGFSLPAVLLGEEAIRTWMLSVAYFQVMIIFVGTTSEAIKRV